jgi:hypothetical protein
MTAGGLNQGRIAQVLGVAPKTLRKHFRQALDNGADRANAAVIGAMFALATKGRPSHVRFQAARYWLACRAGWRNSDRAVHFPQLIPFNHVLRPRARSWVKIRS